MTTPRPPLSRFVRSILVLVALLVSGGGPAAPPATAAGGGDGVRPGPATSSAAAATGAPAAGSAAPRRAWHRGPDGAPRAPRPSADTLTRRELLRSWARSFYPGRSGDVMLVPREGDVLTAEVPFMHGSPWAYDTRVPMLLYGPPRVSPGRYDAPASHQDLGATLAVLLGLPARPATVGRPLLEAFGGDPDAGSRGAALGRRPPRIVVLLVLDAFRAGYFERLGDSLPHLSRLRQQGASFQRARIDYLPTATAPAHTTLSTGAPPAVHGAIGNQLFDRTTGEVTHVYAGADPSHLRALTLADRWTARTAGEAVVAAQGGTFYPATALAGHGTCRVGGRPVSMAYYDDGAGAWATNSRCYRLPSVLRDRNAESVWGEAGGSWMGHDASGPRAFRRTALFARFEADASLATLESLPFGRDAIPDLLLLNWKAGDYVAHRYGPNSREVAAALAEIDRQVGRLTTALEAAAGPGGWVLAVTADHGMAPEPEAPHARRPYATVRRALRERFDPDGPGIVRHIGGADLQVYLDRERMDALGVTVEDAAAHLETLSWVRAAFPATEVREAADALWADGERRPRSPDTGERVPSADVAGGASEAGSGADASTVGRRVAIPEIQGAGHMSALRDREVVTTGVVTATADDGFYLQDAEGDDRPATSDAIFVATGGGDDGERATDDGPAVGDRLRVAATVTEYVPGEPEDGNLSITRLASPRIEILSSGASLPAPVRLGTGGRIPPEVEVIGEEELPVDLTDPDEAAAAPFDPDTEGIDFYESLEGMRVRVSDPVTIGPTARFGEGVGAVYTLVERGAHVTPDDARTAPGGILLQPHPDNRGDQNPERVQIAFDPALYPDAMPVVATGTRLGDVTGVVGYGFGNYEVRATRVVRVRGGGRGDREGRPEPETTELVGTEGRVTVATYNVYNLNPLPESRARMKRLGEQIARRLRAPDVVALQEIQDENGTRGETENLETDATATLRALADAVAAAGGPRYEFVDVAPEPNTTGGVPGGNIRNAFLWNPERVELRNVRSLDPGVLEAAGAPDPEAFEGSRDPLAATFSFRARRFTVVSNHFSSRYGSTPVFGAVHPFVQEGEAAREAQARAVHAWAEHRLEREPGTPIAVVGDLNTFEWTDDLTELLPAGGEDGREILHNLMWTVPPERRYSFVFRGNSEALDHFFITGGQRHVAELDVVHINADRPPTRGPGSDHEPLVGRLRLVP